MLRATDSVVVALPATGSTVEVPRYAARTRLALELRSTVTVTGRPGSAATATRRQTVVRAPCAVVLPTAVHPAGAFTLAVVFELKKSSRPSPPFTAGGTLTR